MPDETKHILGSLQHAIGELKSDIRRMGQLAVANLENASNGLLERNIDACNKAIADDEDVDALEKRIDREGVELIMKFSPMGRDLRRVIATMKAATAVERISDHAVALARRAKSISQHAAVAETQRVRDLYVLAKIQLESALDSFCDGNLQAALSIRGRDQHLDAAYHSLNQAIIARMKEDVDHIPDYVDLLFCSRFLERIGDQSVNISEDAVYLLTAQDIRHGGEFTPKA
jgi:phosphate transport system protein